MSITLTILCENSVNRVAPYGLLGEHGFACHIACPSGNYLFDTGGGLTLLHNAERLGIDLSEIDAAIFSHGHFDHTGGLRTLLQKKSPLPVYAHPDLFSPHLSTNSGTSVAIGLPWQRSELERMGAEFHLHSAPYEIAPGLLLSGQIPRRSTVETGDPNLATLAPDGHQVADPLHDDLSLFIDTPNGLVILLGCAHAGLINIIDHALEVTGAKSVYMVLGGTHLKFCGPEQMQATIERLKELHVERIGAAHCTGLEGALTLTRHFGDRVFNATVGTGVTL